jgi:hypothetical protein
MDKIDGRWIRRRWSNGYEEWYLYVGAFVPNEPFLAVFYNEEEDALETETVYAFLVRVRYDGRLHLVEHIPLVCVEGFLEEATYADNFVGVVPARRFDEMRDFFLKMGRMKGRCM